MKSFFQNESKYWKEDCKLAAVLFAVILFFAFTGIGCPIKFFTGIPCAGCGMTRAVTFAARGSFAEAFHCHPLWVIMPPLLLIWLFRRHIPARILKVIVIAAVFLFLSVYCIRILMQDPIVHIDIHDGFLMQLVRIIWRR